MNEETIVNQRLKEMQELAPTGFALGFHVVFTTPVFMFQTYPKAWLDEYAARGFLMQDPIVHWGFENVGKIRWSELADKDSAGVLEASAGHGIRYGITCAVESQGSRSFGGFSRGDREFTDQEADDLFEGFEDIHNTTAQSKAIDQTSVDALKKMSIVYTNTGVGN